MGSAIGEYWANYCSSLQQALDDVSVEKLQELVNLLRSAYEEERQVFLMGNGGSGANASHFACDLNKGVSFGRVKRFRVLCLNDNLPTLMAYANDVSYEDIFVEPLNVLKAIAYANEHGGHTVGLSGFAGGKLSGIVRTSLVVPIHNMQKAEDVHFILFHVIMQILCARPGLG
jgi:D-sedoheptulose 7-phosphate isomerase